MGPVETLSDARNPYPGRFFPAGQSMKINPLFRFVYLRKASQTISPFLVLLSIEIALPCHEPPNPPPPVTRTLHFPQVPFLRRKRQYEYREFCPGRQGSLSPSAAVVTLFFSP